MVSLIVSIVLTLAMVGVIMWVAERRPVGAPLTWGEAFVAALWLFTLMFLIYGVVPHQFLTYADNDLQWRSDSMGIPTPFGRLFEGGITFFGRGRVMISAQTIRDILASGIYIVALAGQFYLWMWWQGRGKRKAQAPELVSPYGRPLKKA